MNPQTNQHAHTNQQDASRAATPVTEGTETEGETESTQTQPVAWVDFSQWAPASTRELCAPAYALSHAVVLTIDQYLSDMGGLEFTRMVCECVCFSLSFEIMRKRGRG